MKDYMQDPPEWNVPLCPCCGSETYERIVTDGDKIIGCDDCLIIKPAEDWWEELAEQAEDAKYDAAESRWRDE